MQFLNFVMELPHLGCISNLRRMPSVITLLFRNYAELEKETLRHCLIYDILQEHTRVCKDGHQFKDCLVHSDFSDPVGNHRWIFCRYIQESIINHAATNYETIILGVTNRVERLNEVKSDGTISVPNNIGKLDWFLPKMGITFIFTHFSKAT